MTKTNVMRLLEAADITYRTAEYEYEESNLSGLHAAEQVGIPAEQVFKTLVTVGASKKNYVFVIPVCGELNLKDAAKAVGEKSIEMLKSKDLLPLTGYIHGGCSPIGMKKLFPTVIDRSAESYDTIIFSAGKIGYQVQLSLAHLQKVIPFTLADICEI